MTIEVNLKNGTNYIFKNVSRHADIAWDPVWFWVDWDNGGRRYIASSEIQDVLIQEEEGVTNK